MESEIFKAGVRPGAPTSHDEIKMLICYVLSRLDKPVLFSQLHQALLESNLVNYFELVQVVDGLCKTGHLEAEAGERGESYAITDLGSQAGSEFEKTLPSTVREKALKAVETQLRRDHREAQLQIKIEPAKGGYEVYLAIPEGEGSLVSFTMFAPTREECELIRRRFLNDPLFIYQGVLALLTGDRKILGELMPEKEPLF